MSNFECAADTGYVVPFNPEDSFPALDREIRQRFIGQQPLGATAVAGCGGVDTFPPVFSTPPTRVYFAEYPTYL